MGWVCLLPLFFALEGSDTRRTLSLGILAGTVAYLVTCYWIVVAVNRYGGIPFPLAVAVLLLLCLYLGAYWGVFALGLRGFSGDLRWSLGGAALWVFLEYLRAHLLTGFPWAMLAHSQGGVLPLIQVSDLTGAYGVSFLLALANAALYLLRRGRKVPLLVAASLVALSVLYGIGRLEDPIPGPPYRAGICQGNVDQSRKWERGERERIFELHWRLTEGVLGEGADLVLWPETSFPDPFPEGKLSLRLKERVRSRGLYLLFGSLRENEGRLYNSAFLLGPRGEVLGHYDKVHLVPFGEYLPLRGVLERFFGSIEEAVPGDITPGDEVKVFGTPYGAFSVLICFEVIFPGLAREGVMKGAEFLVTITNDAWFGRTSAPYQHLAQAVFRAVETRRWLLRAANTGISAIVSPKGEVVAQTPIFVRTSVTGPFGPLRGLTPYVKLGDWFPWALALVLILCAIPRRPGQGPSS